MREEAGVNGGMEEVPLRQKTKPQNYSKISWCFLVICFQAVETSTAFEALNPSVFELRLQKIENSWKQQHWPGYNYLEEKEIKWVWEVEGCRLSKAYRKENPDAILREKENNQVRITVKSC